MIYAKAVKRRDMKKIGHIRSEAMDRARKVAAVLKEKYGAGRVILFGSIIHRAYLHERSDIDLLVEGLSKHDLLHAGFDACAVAMPFDVDIIQMETAHDYIIKRATAEGMEL